MGRDGVESAADDDLAVRLQRHREDGGIGMGIEVGIDGAVGIQARAAGGGRDRRARRVGLQGREGPADDDLADRLHEDAKDLQKPAKTWRASGLKVVSSEPSAALKRAMLLRAVGAAAPLGCTAGEAAADEEILAVRLEGHGKDLPVDVRA